VKYLRIKLYSTVYVNGTQASKVSKHTLIDDDSVRIFTLIVGKFLPALPRVKSL